MSHDALKHLMITAGKILVAEGQDDFTRGHISVRLPDNPSLFYMKPHSIGLDEITMESILTIDMNGEVVAGSARRHSEVYIHSEIYKVRSDVNCVLHTHPTYATALSAMGKPISPISQPGALFHNACGIYTDSMALIRSQEMGAGVARALGPHRAVLMKNHGVAVATASIQETVISVIMLENAAQIQMIAEAAGTPAPTFPSADIEKLKDQVSRPDQFVVNFDYLARRAQRREQSR